MRRYVALLLFCMVFLLFPMQSFASMDVNSDLDNLAKHIQDSELNSDWDVIALAKIGKLTDSERSAYLESVKDRVSAKALSGTDLDKTAMVVQALGEDPTNFQNHDLIQSIYTDSSIKSLMDFTYALMVLGSDDYTIPSDALWTPDQFIDKLLPLQTISGGWGWAGDPNGDPDVDTTCMVLTALSRYPDQAKPSIDKAINYLRSAEQADGGFINYSPNSNSAAQVIIALSSLGIDPTSGDFDKNGHNPVNSLDQYKSNGGYKWAAFSESDDPFSNEQVLQALAAYSLFANGDQLFNFREATMIPSSDTSAGELNLDAEKIPAKENTSSQESQKSDAVVQDSSTSTKSVTAQTESPTEPISSARPSVDKKETVQPASDQLKGGSTAKEKANLVSQLTAKNESKADAERSKANAPNRVSQSKSKTDTEKLETNQPKQHQTKTEPKKSLEQVTTTKQTHELNPFHLYFGSGFILLGMIGLYVYYRLGGVRREI
ncbi:prenyltransferase/squalene oxidase repeat-containing protein [Sporolactobacillus nakayamae]|uniref:Prenyltransferase and squalene oxidase repeat-containing protein n=1 Tax=Sporolactobacillus nakayamae TaxID=269670 RepID=A0A1I2UEI5_9BACL|nr:prenyltransferase/squalene oxidase repeat-containing protein [Sporolactobacillus nakayamae]SFG74789.1 Prenyltransferase and squalene oxidase repeat-containing protein [Sporolactobacillus nakayamae]